MVGISLASIITYDEIISKSIGAYVYTYTSTGGYTEIQIQENEDLILDGNSAYFIYVENATNVDIIKNE